MRTPEIPCKTRPASTPQVRDPRASRVNIFAFACVSVCFCALCLGGVLPVCLARALSARMFACFRNRRSRKNGNPKNRNRNLESKANTAAMATLC